MKKVKILVLGEYGVGIIKRKNINNKKIFRTIIFRNLHSNDRKFLQNKF